MFETPCICCKDGPGLVVKGGDSEARNLEFESQDLALDGHISHDWCKNSVFCFKMTENKPKVPATLFYKKEQSPTNK